MRISIAASGEVGAAARRALPPPPRAPPAARAGRPSGNPRLSRGSDSDSTSSACRRIVAAQRAVQLLHRHAQAMLSAQPLGDGVVHLGRASPPRSCGERLGRLFQRGEMVGAVVEKVARLLVRQQDAPAGRQRDAAGILARDAPGAVQRQHRARGVRAAGRPAPRLPRPARPRRPAAGRRRPRAGRPRAGAPAVPDSVRQIDAQASRPA